jgi:hypothetical protein
MFILCATSLRWSSLSIVLLPLDFLSLTSRTSYRADLTSAKA